MLCTHCVVSLTFYICQPAAFMYPQMLCVVVFAPIYNMCVSMFSMLSLYEPFCGKKVINGQGAYGEGNFPTSLDIPLCMSLKFIFPMYP